MSSYSELIKNFEKIRAYMRDFYVYGFKSRDDYRTRSARSYRVYDADLHLRKHRRSILSFFERDPHGKENPDADDRRYDIDHQGGAQSSKRENGPRRRGARRQADRNCRSETPVVGCSERSHGFSLLGSLRIDF